jgi:hypothetical protein
MSTVVEPSQRIATTPVEPRMTDRAAWEERLAEWARGLKRE